MTICLREVSVTAVLRQLCWLWIAAALGSVACTETSSVRPTPVASTTSPVATTAKPTGKTAEQPTATPPVPLATATSTASAPACPAEMVLVDALCVDRLEVTTAAYAECVEAGACARPRSGGLCTFERNDALPINCVTAAAAAKYCAFRDKTLPTEAEWELAAGAGDGRAYPWGDDPPGKQLCWDGHGNDLGHGNRHELCRGGSYPGDVSPAGVLDLGGSLSEWTLGEVRRGGSWGSKAGPQLIRIDTRRTGAFDDYAQGIFTGFRCVAALKR